MIISEKKVVLAYPIEKIWKIMIDNENYQWRTDLSKIEIIDENHFEEYTSTGFVTKFEIIKKNSPIEYEMNLENVNMKGHFVANLKKLAEEETELVLKEEIEVKKKMMTFMAKPYLKKQQEKYVRDLVGELKRGEQ